MFIIDNEWKALSVIGESESGKILNAVIKTMTKVDSEYDYEIGATLLDTDPVFQSKDVHNMFLISFGSPCINQVTANLLGTDFPYCEWIWEGRQVIEVVDKNANDPYYSLVVFGKTDDETVEAINSLI